MRFFGHDVSIKMLSIRSGLLFLLLTAWIAPAFGQSAPYVLPYTMSTFAGPNAATKIGTVCGSYVALDAYGDGCPAAYVSVGSDPHDIRVDGQGNVYWIDNTSPVMIHKISASTGVETAYLGSDIQTASCTTGNGDKVGDGCPANDGAANTVSKATTSNMAKSRGLGVAANGDLFLADYGGSEDHKISASTGIQSLIAGNGTGGYLNGPVGVNGAAGQNQVSTTRGIGVDSNNGNVFIADTGNNMLREITGGQVIAVTAVSGTTGSGSGGCIKNVTNQPASTATLCAPEDTQVDTNGNVYIADAGNNVVRAIYCPALTNCKGSLPGITNPTPGWIYNIAGFNALEPGATTSSAYPAITTSNCTVTNCSTPTVLPLTVTIGLRKIGLDSHNNLYIADAAYNVIWFVDNATGYMRLIGGLFNAPTGGIQPLGPLGCPASVAAGNKNGDGCPGPLASMYSSGGDAANSADAFGNLYFTDSGGENNAPGSASAQENQPASARLRKILNGLNFPGVTVGGTSSSSPAGPSLTQIIFIHFGPNDTPIATNPFVSSNTDFVVGTPSCSIQTAGDQTDDCFVPITFTPTKPGNDTATLTATATLGGKNSFLLTGTGYAPEIVIDPGTVSLLTPTTPIKAAQGVAFDGAGNAYIADTSNNRVLFYSAASSTWSTFAGTGVSGYTGDNALATLATLNSPKAVTIDLTGSVYIADSGNNVIRKVNSAGIISTYAGGASTVCSQAINTRGDGCFATQAIFSGPSGVIADNLGDIYVSDTGNNVIRQINSLGNVITFAGGATTVCTAAADTYGDGCSATQAVFGGPTGLAYDAKGNFIIVADTQHQLVRKISIPNTIITTGSGSTTVGTALYNPVTAVAGNEQAGSSVDAGNVAIKSQLNYPTGVAVDPAENVYIADTLNESIRLVNASTGLISTIVGINGSLPGTGTAPPTSAANIQLSSPGGVAVAQGGLIYVLDSGNNRILTDARSQVAYNFGRTNDGFSSPVQNFVEVSIGTLPAALPTPLYVASGNISPVEFTLTAPSGSSGCVASEALPIGISCVLQAQFTPTATGNYSATYTETNALSAGAAPSITLNGIGAVLTTTTGAVLQTTPTLPANSQYGGSVTLTATITAASANNAAPTTYPTGTVRIVVDSSAQAPVTLAGTSPNLFSTGSQSVTGLSVGTHTISCNYSGDNFYAASTCPGVTITVAQAQTTAAVIAAPNNQAQYPKTNCVVLPATAPLDPNDTRCYSTTITATVASTTSGTPGGTVTFYASGIANALGTAPLGPTGIGSIQLYTDYDKNLSANTDITLPPGTYSITCTYSGSTNFAASACPGFSLTIIPSPASFTLVPRGCAANELYEAGSSTPGEGVGCASNSEVITNGTPTIATADGSTTDATIFVNASNTVSGTLTFSCSGMPATTICAFLPTSITLVPGSGYVTPLYTDMTLWTDIQSSSASNAPSIGKGKNNVTLAMIFGWPLTLAGLFGLIRFRRSRRTLSALSLLALVLVLSGSSLVFTGCAGPGLYKPVLTPAGTYPITVTVTGDGITASTLVNFKVTSPGIVGQQ